MKQILLLILLNSVFFTGDIIPQHRGDLFFFQGIPVVNDGSPASLARGGTYTSESGDLNSMYFNPAGIAGIKKTQISVFGNRDFKLWRENQNYYPSKYFATLAFYLEGLYTPKLINDGKEDMMVVKEDANYVISDPKMGLDPFSRAAADWQKTRNNYTPVNCAFVLPLGDMVDGLTLGGLYTQNRIFDYDRNDTYLIPHPGYSFYNVIQQANLIKPVIMHWYRYYRNREGLVHNAQLSTAFKLNESIQFGISVAYFFGKSDDNIGLNKYGYFNILKQNSFEFYFTKAKYYDTSYGTSKYASLRVKAGAVVSFSKFKIGVTIGLPYTIARNWDYSHNFTYTYTVNDTINHTTYDKIGLTNSKISGKDILKMPASFSLGLSYTPKPSITLAFDIDYTPYGNADYEIARPDSSFQKWANQLIFKAGIEYRAFKFLEFAMGYRNIPQVFVPDGSAIKVRGPIANSYCFGAGLILAYGRIDIAYEFRQLLYYDSYYSNVNYNTELSDKFSVGYTFTF